MAELTFISMIRARCSRAALFSLLTLGLVAVAPVARAEDDSPQKIDVGSFLAKMVDDVAVPVQSEDKPGSPNGFMKGPVLIGWAEAEITPEALPVGIAGQFPSRISEGIADPLFAAACAFERDGEHVVFVGCDLVSISDELLGQTRLQLASVGEGLDPNKVILNASHTHTGPECRTQSATAGHTSAGGNGIDLGETPSDVYIAFAAKRIAECVATAWRSRSPGGIAFGLDYAVVGRNRRWVDASGKSTMYGLKAPATESFRHFEGYEDHSLNLLATYSEKSELTGIIVNLPCPSQETGAGFELSADFWDETRRELRQRFGKNLYILPQVSAAGELTSRALYEKAANDRMAKLRERTAREEIAQRIADAVGRILPYLDKTIDRAPVLHHRVEQIKLPANRLTQADVDKANEEAGKLRLLFEAELRKLKEQPELRNQPRWYVRATEHFRRMSWYKGVAARFERQKTEPNYSHEIHIVRLGEIAFATNPFEYYLDFGIQIKVRSPAIQTFLVQLTGQGTYLPSPRSVAGGGYGSVPASNPLGPEAGQVLVDRTVDLLRGLWDNETAKP